MIRTYRNTAGVEGGVAGAGGFVLAAADFPALMAIKVRALGDVVGAYGWGGDTVRERRMGAAHSGEISHASYRIVFRRIGRSVGRWHVVQRHGQLAGHLVLLQR